MLVTSNQTTDSHEEPKRRTTLKHNFANRRKEAISTMTVPKMQGQKQLKPRLFT